MLVFLGVRNSDFCQPFVPFKCPTGDMCISIQYLCDGASDCPNAYDEDPRLCTAGKPGGEITHRALLGNFPNP